MKMLPVIERAMKRCRGSFINHNNELILIPKFNVYFSLNDVETEEDFVCKMCEWFSRDCCCAMRYKRERRLAEYWEFNTHDFNFICGTDFEECEMREIYQHLGNAINHDLTLEFVRSGFNLDVLEGDCYENNG